ncbi:MAG: undecaprenyl-phosphate glucose phosphotransferase [Bacteroidaceae bacterium]|nr:undecaprenyl-phosphate glucose phosphotransferase [Bacteroidaceae bacterium]
MATYMGKESTLKGCIMLIDIALLITVILGVYYVEGLYYTPKIASVGSLPALIAIFVASFLASYSIYPSLIQKRIVKSEDVAKRVTTTCLLMFLFVSMLLQFTRGNSSFPRSFLLTVIIIYTPLLFAERLSVRKIFVLLRSKKRNVKNIILIGSEMSVYDVYKTLSNPEYGYNIKGIFYDGDSEFEEFKSMKLGETSDIYMWLMENNDINEIYGYIPAEKQDTINMIGKFADNHLIRFYYIPVINVFGQKISMEFVDSTPIIAKREEPLAKPLNKAMKRAFDILVSSMVLILIFPWLFVFVAIMIKIKSPGPIFFKQERTGLDGKIFFCYKFRSMKVNKDADKIQATKDDPRKFPFGDFMRKTNIDEFPQFINVFKGDMSLVGPRPHMLLHTEEYSKLINRFMVRHLAKPGITGLAQVTGFRGETKYIDQMEGRVKKDIEYIENWTFFLDIKIMVKTVTNMFCGEKNAY